jgi:hypothetical protein
MASKSNPALDFLKKTIAPTTEGLAPRMSVEDVVPRVVPDRQMARLKSDLTQSDIQRTAEKITKDQDLDDNDQMILEAIIIPDKRPAIDIIPVSLSNVRYESPRRAAVPGHPTRPRGSRPSGRADPPSPCGASSAPTRSARTIRSRSARRRTAAAAALLGRNS